MQRICIKTIFLFWGVLLVNFSSATAVHNLFMGKESSVILIEIPGAVNDGQDTYSEWTVETQHDRILFLTLSTADGSPLDEKQLQSLAVYDALDLSPIIFTTTASESELKVSPSRSVYSPGNSIVIKYHPDSVQITSTLLQLKIEKAADCPINIGGFSSCGRITDQVSCYCATFTNRTWDATRLFCNQNGMRFAAIESYAEDQAIWNAWGGQLEAFWIGLSDFGQEGKFVWEATGGLLSSGYKNWQLGQPDNAGVGENCGHINFGNRIGWNDFTCNSNYIGSQPLGGICELQP